MKRFALVFALVSVVSTGFLKPAHADIYNSEVCQIEGTDCDALDYAVRLYNFSENRGCTYELNFMTNGTMTCDHAITITGDPIDMAGGTIIRGYPGRAGGAPVVNSFILDLTGRGNCPVKIDSGSKIFMARMTLKVDNIDKAVCDLENHALYSSVDSNGHVTQTDAQKNSVTIYNTVTVQEEGIVIPPNTDPDGDGVTGAADLCPNDDGTAANQGCPDNKCIAPNGAVLNESGIDADGDGIDAACDRDDVNHDPDGDGIRDAADLCPADVGTATNGGCPATKCISQVDGSVQDRTGIDADADGIDAACDSNDTPVVIPVDTDGDGIPDTTDLCGAEAGSAANGGCPATKCISQVDGSVQDRTGIDADGDGIDAACDSNDTPVVIPVDTDGDGIPDTTDLCGAEAGSAANGGCPATKCISQVDGSVQDVTGVDVDGDGIDAACDRNDLVVSASDGDGDGVVDSADLCPTEPGLAANGGCPATKCISQVDGSVQDVSGIDLDADGIDAACDRNDLPSGVSDTDGDGIADSADLCPTEPGLAANGGCPATKCISQVDGSVQDVTGVDADGDGIDAACDRNDATSDSDGDGIADGSDLCPGDPGSAANGGCPDTVCISQVDGQPKTRQNVDADGDGIDAACDSNDVPPARVSAPTCDLTSMAVDASFSITWSTADAAVVSLTEGATPLSSDPSGSVTVTPAAETVYTLTATNAGGSCSRGITLSPGAAVPGIATCDLSVRENEVADAPDMKVFEINWSTTNATAASLGDGVTVLSSELSGETAVPATEPKTFGLAAVGDRSSCARAISVVPSPTVVPPSGFIDSDGDGISDATELEKGTNPNAADTDGDGINDPFDCAPTDATKATGESCAAVSTDPDGDGIQSSSDNCPFVANADQKDENTNGVGDICEGSPGVSTTDSDADGIPDDIEVRAFGTDPSKADTDGDGLNDGQEVTSPLYPVLVAREGGFDSDHDGICDGPATVTDANGNTLCATFNGKGDNCPIAPNGPNTQGLSPDLIQKDSAGDGIGDACRGDVDGDLVPDDKDNCPIVDNPNQEDHNLTTPAGDACDPNFSQSSGSGSGCGACRMASGPTQLGDLIPFALMAIPMALLRRFRKRVGGS